MFYQLYKILGLLLVVVLTPVFWLHPRGRLKLSQRFGNWGQLADQVIWLHGASVGEVNGLLAILPGLRERYPGQPILLTATSTSGLDRANGKVDFQRLLPFDCSLFIIRALRGTQVNLFIFGETELWPCLLHYLQKRAVPIVMLNATISDFTWKTYRILNYFLPQVLGRINFIAASNQRSLDRFLQLGVDSRKIKLTGNTKYCQNYADNIKEDGKKLAARYFSEERPILVLGSLRPGEEQFWLPTLNEFAARINVVIVPRHPEKIEYFRNTLDSVEIRYVLESQQVQPVHGRVLLIDSIGKLVHIYAVANLAFVGGSLVAGFGGHNPLEPAAFGVPICIGPLHQNVNELVEEMLALDACLVVNTQAEIRNIVAECLVDNMQLNAMGSRANQYFLSKQTAVQEVLTLIDQLRR